MSDSADYQFNEFSFRPDTGELTGPSGRIRLEPQPARLLAFLIAHVGELVTRDELRTELWADKAIEADQGINYCIRAIRVALGDDAESERFIETLPRRGYRFTGRLAPPPPSSPPPPARAKRPLRALLPAICGIAIAAIVFLVAERNRARPLIVSESRIAVLPLSTPESATRWTSVNGQLTELLVEHLTNGAPALAGVVGPVTTARLVNDSRPHTVLGAELRVDYVLSGGVRDRDTTVFVQVIRVRDGNHVFALRRKLLGSSPEAIAREIATGVAAKITLH